LKCVCTRATLLGPLSNFLYYSKVPAAVLPWLNLAVPAIGLLLVLIGVVRAFRQPQFYRGKILGSPSLCWRPYSLSAPYGSSFTSGTCLAPPALRK